MNSYFEITAKRTRIRTGERPPKMVEQCKMTLRDAVTWQSAMVLEGRRSILTGSQTKLDKAAATDTGYINKGLTMASADDATPFINQKFNACRGSTATCRAACVGSKTGQGKFTSSNVARIGRTLAMLCDVERFDALLDCEIEAERMRADVFGFTLAIRFNIATDHWREANECAKRHPLVKFYDYSAIAAAVRQIDSVQRVYSRKDGEKRHLLTLSILKEGHGVSVVFDVEKANPLPSTWEGFPVVDGDVNDLWFLRAPKNGPFVVGLRAKGTTAQRRQCVDSGFAVRTAA